MFGLLGFVRRGWFIGLVGLIFLSLIIWFFGPYLALGGWKPLASMLVRAVVILVLFLLWILITAFKYNRRRKADRRLREEIVKQDEGDSSGVAEELRNRFEQAVHYLRRSGRKTNLYELPWYVIIGPPGSGKTTALQNSGLEFPLEQRYGDEALRGVGGTRNCDWWFTNEAVFLDTAGRYVTQDSDKQADSTEWRAFLDLLVKYRRRRPINGVLVTLSAADLLSQSDEQRRTHVRAVRTRLEELRSHFKIQFPVYFLVTKCDLIAGFSEFFDDLGHDDRNQVWGMTFPAEERDAKAASKLFGSEFDELLARLNQRVLMRLDQERDPQRRALIFGFPRQMSALRSMMGDFLHEAFGGTTYDRPVQLRGAYFTSGTQEGTPIDRIMGTLSKSFGIDAGITDTRRQQGRSFFIHRLLTEVVFPESGLAGVNWRYEVGRALAQNVAYISVVVVALVMVLGWFTSYQLNVGYLDRVHNTIAVQEGQATQPVPGNAGFAEILPRLDALREIAAEAGRYREGHPILMGLGLYRGGSISKSAQAAYHQGLTQLLLPRVARYMERQMVASARSPQRLYRILKAYLMLAQPEHLDRDQLVHMVNREFKRLFVKQPAVGAALGLHFDNLVHQSETLQIDDPATDLITQAQASLGQASVPVLMLSRLESIYTADHKLAINLRSELGLGASEVFQRKGGKTLSDPIPALYTKAGFEEITGTVGGSLVGDFLSERWVLGADNLPQGPTARFRLAAEFLKLYENRYIEYWDNLLANMNLAPLLDVGHAAKVLGIISGRGSPLRGFLQLAHEQTYFPPPKTDGVAAAAATAGKLSGLVAAVGQASGDLGSRPGKRISEHFKGLHELMQSGQGGRAPIDGIVALLGQLYQQLNTMGGGLGQQDAISTLTQSGGAQLLRQLRTQAERWPAPMGHWLQSLAGAGEEVAMRRMRSALNAKYRGLVLPQCRELVSGRYPFFRNSRQPLPLADFKRLFGPRGVLNTFFDKHLQELVDTASNPWRWKTTDGGSIGIPNAVLRPFQRARMIQDIFFASAAGTHVAFSLTPLSLDRRAQRFVFKLDDQVLTYRHGPPRPKTFQWPGAAGGKVVIQFEDRTGKRPNLVFEGPWAWFQSLDAGTISERSDSEFIVTYQVGGLNVQLLVTFSSTRNPLNLAIWRKFRCPTSL